ncbi:MAG: 4-hydroxybenzoyl-CoA reductase subunit beta [Alphaproteobacteria bacterium]|nr:4-hydroxybenzoyl-CoA reductase subunit beta [Alphaproteobacteria bacterium]
MEALPEFALARPRTIAELAAARAAHPDAGLLGGGTDLMVNIRRGIVAPKVLIETKGVAALRTIAAAESGFEIGASATLVEIAEHAELRRHFPGVAEAAQSIAGPTQRIMGTLGGNLCLDTRCIYYNQSQWWRAANDHCLKTTGTMCHVAPKSRGVCFATYSGDLAPALMALGAKVELLGPAGQRRLDLAALYIGESRHDGKGKGDGKNFLGLLPGEIVLRVRVEDRGGWRSGYDKMRIRRSIEYPVAGVAVALKREGDALAGLGIAVTGTNPRPVLLEGTEALLGRAPDAAGFAKLDDLVRDQIMAMKTTFTQGFYRRRVAGVLARRLVERLWNI